MHVNRSLQLALLLALAGLAIAYRVLFIATRRLAVEADYPPGAATGRPAGGTA